MFETLVAASPMCVDLHHFWSQLPRSVCVPYAMATPPGWVVGGLWTPPPCAVGQIFSWLKAGLENFVRLLGCNFVILAGFGGWFGS